MVLWLFLDVSALFLLVFCTETNCSLRNAKVYLLGFNCRRRMAETKGTGGCPRDGKLKWMGPPSSCLSFSGISVCAIRLGLRRLEDGRSRDG